MADVSLDDYIQQKGIRIQKRTTVGALQTKTTTAFGTNNNKKQIAVKRPFSAPTINKILPPQKQFDARQKLSSQKPEKSALPDARQKLLQKSKFADARQHILNKKQKMSAGSNVVADARAKLQAKRGIDPTSTWNDPVAQPVGFRNNIQFQQQQQMPQQQLQQIQQLPQHQFQQMQQQQQQMQQQQMQQQPQQNVMPGWGVFNSAVSHISPVVQQQQQPLQGYEIPPQGIGNQPPGVGILNIGGTLMKTITTNPPFPPNVHTINWNANVSPLMGQPMQPPMRPPMFNSNPPRLVITARNDQPTATNLQVSRNCTQPAAVRQATTTRQTTIVQRGTAAKPRFPAKYSTTEVQPIQTLISRTATKVTTTNLASETVNKPKATNAAKQASAPVDAISPLQGFRVIVNNLVTSVTYEDVEELFGAVGALRKVKMVKPGSAEVFFINREDAVAAIKKYNLRELDGHPMTVVLAGPNHGGAGDSTSSPAAGSSSFQPLKLKKSVAKETVDIDPTILHSALFKPLTEQAAPVSFTVHM